LPLFNSAGTSMSGFLFGNQLGSWSLSSGFRNLQRGHFLISPNVTLPAQRKTYTLKAQSHPDVAGWRLSTEVDDTWKFSSKSGQGVVPLLMASYVPPTSLSGYIAPGRVGYRLDLDNLGRVETRVVKVALKYSTDDGRSWRKASLHRLDKNSFRVSYISPSPTREHHFVSLLVTAKDAAGRTVTERAIRAYQINKPHGPPSPAQRPSPSHADSGQADGATRACAAHSTRTYNCFALIERRGQEALTKAGDPAGWGAQELRDAYAIPTSSSDQTVAVVVAFNYPSAEADMNKYRRQFGLPQCTSESGCFTKINQRGVQGSYPFADQGWALEAALDLQMISASCPTCHIVLAEAKYPFDKALNKATDAAVAAGADITNHSYGLQEFNGIVDNNPHYAVDGVTAVAATGDFGYQPASFPASSPDVVSVGGTVLHHASNARGWRENAWRFGGSGCSAYFDKPDFQVDTACTNRTFSDVSAVADGVAVYDSFGFGRRHGWFVIGGTSVSSPLVAGMIGAAGAGGLKPGALYGNPAAFHDIARGSNGFCRGSYICTAVPGYDGPTGWGTPRGLDPFAQVN
ncbi:MAG: S8 family serine peptidase, partial [Nocardioidaceae bacterium]